MQRTICISNPCAISVKSNCLRIEGSTMGKVRIPLEDIWVVIIDSMQITLSSSALSSLAENGIGLMTCGKNHMPNGLHLPIGAHSRHAAIVESQLLMSKPLKKQIWQRIVISKINNQALCLEYLGSSKAKNIREIAKEVKSGDSTNRESVAAAAYFRALLNEGSRRNGPYEAPLNYGYAILRAGIGRSAVAGGWLVSQGIHHNNNLNAFNLVDDLIEPFRPIVDLMVATYPYDNGLDSNAKHYLTSVFEHMVTMNEKHFSVQSAIVEMLNSFKAAVLEKNAQLLTLPQLIPLAKIEVEQR